MTLTEKINSNPYLKVSNCTDLSDIEYGISEIKSLELQYGQSKTLTNLLGKFLVKKNRLKS